MRYQRDPFHIGQTYHLYNKAVGNEQLFRTTKDYKQFLERFARYLCPFVDVYAYCLMPNHFHFMIKIQKPSNSQLKKENTSCSIALLNDEIQVNKFIESQLSRMLSGYTLSFNRRTTRMGQLFKQGTKRVNVKSPSKFVHLISYIHHNPIHHAITDSFQQWTFSSYNAYLRNANTLIAKKEILDFLGGRSEFHRIHKSFVEDFKISKLNDPVVPWAQ